MKPSTKTQLALRYLVKHGASCALDVGFALWPNRTSKTTSMGGGGDYAAQMLLGRMRAAGLVRDSGSDGSTRWEVTALGRARVAA